MYILYTYILQDSSSYPIEIYANLPAVSGFIEQVVYDLKEFQNTIISLSIPLIPHPDTCRYLDVELRGLMPGSQRIPVDIPDPSARYHPVQNISTGIQ